MTDDNTPICYPYLTGWLEQTLRGLTYDLVAKGLVDRDKQEVLEKIINEKIESAIKAERDYSIVK
jgi:hypothetical protein